jgi:hypothetical protein
MMYVYALVNCKVLRTARAQLLLVRVVTSVQKIQLPIQTTSIVTYTRDNIIVRYITFDVLPI